MSRRSALITGGSSGIGLACAVALHHDGWDVTLLGRREGRLAEAADAIVRGPGDPCGQGTAEVHTVSADLSEPDAPTRWQTSSAT